MKKFSNNMNLNKSFDKKSEINSIVPSNYELDKQNILNSCELINEYIILNNQALNNIPPKQALSCYDKAYSIADKLRDEFKKKESACNKGIVYYRLNDIKNAIKYLQPCYNYFHNFCSKEDNIDLQNLTLLCKTGANLCLCKMSALHDKDDCMSIINEIINILSQEEDVNNQLFCIKYLINIFFNVNNVSSINTNFTFNSWKDKEINSFEDKEEEINKIKQLYNEAFYHFISTEEIDTWINNLDNIYQKMNELKYKSGMINILFNQQIAICLKNMDNDEESNIITSESELNEAKIKLYSLIKSISQISYNNDIKNNFNNNNEDVDSLDEEMINNIINEYKYKLSTIKEIYDILNNFEDNINNKFRLNGSQNKNNDIINQNYYKNSILNEYSEEYNFNLNNEYYLMLLLRYTINYFEKNIEDYNLKAQLINNIELAINAINNPQESGIDLSNINLSSLDCQLSDSLCNKFILLFEIYRKNKLRKYFNIFRKNKPKKIIKVNQEKYNIPLKSSKKNEVQDTTNDYFERAYSHIYNGENITKINFRTNNSTIYYFQVDYQNDLLQFYFVNNKTRPKKEFDFDDILKVKIGFETRNVIKKLNIIKACMNNKNQPYRFMSFIFSNDEKQQTLDLVFNDGNSAKAWFYGLFYYFQISNRPYKICSCTRYILNKMKCKIYNKLKWDASKVKQLAFSQCIKVYFNENKQINKKM